jgi:hypothetical protein
MTTGRLHTSIEHVYSDLELITGLSGLVTHMLPRASKAVEPWLRVHVTDPRFWDNRHDPSHTGELRLPEPTETDRKLMMQLYFDQLNPFSDKDVVLAVI